MSRDSSATRERILAAARALFRERGYHRVGLEEIGAAAGVSRQSVYLHFGSKAGLYTAMADWIGEQERVGERLASVWEAPSGVEALERLLDVHAVIEPRLQPDIDVTIRARGTDETIDALYDDLMRQRYDGMRAIVRRIKAEGRLAEGWDVESATGFVWAMTSSSAFRLLVVERGWSARRWAQRTLQVLKSALVVDGPEVPDRSDEATKRPR